MLAKLYYPAEFVCALLNNQPMGFYPSHVLVNDAKRHGIQGGATGRERQRLGLLGRAWPGSADRPRIRQGIAGGRRRHASSPNGQRTAPSAPWPISSAGCPSAWRSAERLIAVGAFDAFGLRAREALWQLGLFVTTRRVGKQLQQAAPVKTRPSRQPCRFR